jgi:hypothetical protein
MNRLELKVMEEFFNGYFSGGMQQYTISMPFLKINCWSTLGAGKNRFVPLKLKVFAL